MVAFTEQAYVRYTTAHLSFLFGRDFLKWGPGVTGQLLLSDYSRPLDHFMFSYRSGLFQYSFFTAQLNPLNLPDTLAVKFRTPIAHRFLTAHRLDLKLSRRFYFSITEAVLYGGPDQQVSFAYLNPFVFYYGTIVNSEGPQGNIVGTVACDLYPGKKWQVYGEVMIDDIQVEKTGPGDLEPSEIGYTAGIRKSDPFGVSGMDVGVEYVRITNRTYKAVQPWEWWLHRNWPIGYYLGSDLDHWQFYISQWINPNLQVKLQFNMLRQGEGRMSKPWDEPWQQRTVEEGYSEPFPTGIVEKTRVVQFEAIYHPHVDFRVTMKAEYRDVENLWNIPGKSSSEWVLRIGLWWEYAKLLRIVD